MKKVLGIILIVIVLLIGAVWFFVFRNKKPRFHGPDPVALKVGKHSQPFNQSVDNILASYYALTEGFVQWDTTVIATQATALKTALDSFNIEELKKDTAGIYESAAYPLDNSKGAVSGILSSPTIDAKRSAFQSLSENLRDMLFAINYETGRAYWYECETALGEMSPGGWLSKTETVRNPYQGINHPTLKDQQLGCGEMKFVIPKDSAR